jgi:hypothetical protein
MRSSFGTPRPRLSGPSFGDAETSFWTHPISSTLQSWQATWNAYTAPSTPAPSSPPPSGGGRGYYAEGGYVYLYDPDAASITIVASPVSANQTKVSAGTTAYNAILSAIKTGKARPIPPEQVKSYRNTVKAKVAAKPVTGYTPAPVSAPAPAIPEASSAASSVENYAPWIVLGLGLTGAAVIILTAPKKRS